jgi:ribosomal peptide maturation radical SAM protein 1
MHGDKKNILLIAMPFAGTIIPSIQLQTLEGYLRERNVDIKTRHLYLKAAEFYGLNNYNFLINSPNDSYTAQMIFSKYVFPEHWKKTKDKFKEYFNGITAGNPDIQKNFTFESYVEQTNEFYHWVLENINWRPYDIIGFTLNYGQFLPSLAIAKKIKESHPEKKIVLGGSRTIDGIGIKVLEAFEYVDFIISGEGEEALYRLALDYQNPGAIPNLIYRDEKEIIWNKSEIFIDLNTLPIPSYDSFFKELASTSEEVKQYFYCYGRLPVEISRGCWWNKCTFCNVKAQYSKYREKNFARIVEEIRFLSEKYKLLTFQIIGNTLPKKDYRTLLKEIKKIGKDFTFYVEARAGQLKNEDYKLLKETGFITIQTGIETFSQNYLRKMNKGVRIIDNIASLKYCKENGIENRYNIIVNYPNEEKKDFEETQRNTRLFMQYLDPPQISYLRVGIGSPIYENPEEFNIEKLEYTNIDKIMFPQEFLEKGLLFSYGFKRKGNHVDNDWEKLVTEWRKIREELTKQWTKRQTAINKLVFYYVDGGSFLKIYDRRNIENVIIYVLDKLEREIFLSCTEVTSIKELRERFSHVPEDKLADVLKAFEESGIVFREDENYLSLPLRYNLAL